MEELELDGADVTGDLDGLDFFGNIERRVTLMGGDGIDEITRGMLNRIKCMGGPVKNYCKDDYIKESLRISEEGDLCNTILTRNRCVRANDTNGLIEIDKLVPRWITVYEKVRLVCLLELNNQFNLSVKESSWFNSNFVNNILYGTGVYGELDYESVYNGIKFEVMGLISFDENSILSKEMDGIKENSSSGENPQRIGIIYPYDQQFENILTGDGTIEPHVSQYISGVKNAAFKYELANTPRSISQYFVGLADLDMTPNIQTKYTTSWGNGLEIKYVKLKGGGGETVNAPLNHKIVRVSNFIKFQIEKLNTVSIYTLCFALLSSVLQGVVVIKEEFKVSVLYITMCFLKEKEIIRMFFSNTMVQNHSEMFNSAINYLCIPYISAVLHTLNIESIKRIYEALEVDAEMIQSGVLGMIYKFIESMTENELLSWVSTDLLFPNQSVLYCDGLTKGIVNAGVYAYALEQIANNFGMQGIVIQDSCGKYYQYQFGGLLYQKVLACHAADYDSRVKGKNTQMFKIENGVFVVIGKRDDNMKRIYSILRTHGNAGVTQNQGSMDVDMVSLTAEIKLNLLRTTMLERESIEFAGFKSRVKEEMELLKQKGNEYEILVGSLMEEKQTLISSMQEEGSQLLMERSGLLDQLNVAKIEIQKLYAYIEGREKLIASKWDANNTSEAEINIIIAERENLKRELEEKEGKLRVVQQELEVRQGSCFSMLLDSEEREKQLKEEIQDIEAKFEYSKKSEDRFRSQVAELKDEIKELEDGYKQLCLESQELTGQVEALEGSLEIKEKKLIETTDAYNIKLKQLNKKHKKMVDELTGAFNTERETYEKDRVVLKELIGRLKGVVTDMKKEAEFVSEGLKTSTGMLEFKLTEVKSLNASSNVAQLTFYDNYKKEVMKMIDELESRIINVDRNIADDGELEEVNVKKELTRFLQIESEDIENIKDLWVESLKASNKLKVVEGVLDGGDEYDPGSHKADEALLQVKRSELDNLLAMLAEASNRKESNMERVGDLEEIEVLNEAVLQKRKELSSIQQEIRISNLEFGSREELIEERDKLKEKLKTTEDIYYRLKKEATQERIKVNQYLDKIDEMENVNRINRATIEVVQRMQVTDSIGNKKEVDVVEYMSELQSNVEYLKEMIKTKDVMIRNLQREVAYSVVKASRMERLADTVNLMNKSMPVFIDGENINFGFPKSDTHFDPKNLYEEWVENKYPRGEDIIKVLITYKGDVVDDIEEVNVKTAEGSSKMKRKTAPVRNTNNKRVRRR